MKQFLLILLGITFTCLGMEQPPRSMNEIQKSHNLEEKKQIAGDQSKNTSRSCKEKFKQLIGKMAKPFKKPEEINKS